MIPSSDSHSKGLKNADFVKLADCIELISTRHGVGTKLPRADIKQYTDDKIHTESVRFVPSRYDGTKEMLKSEKIGKSIDDDVAYRVGTIHAEVGIVATGWAEDKRRCLINYYIILLDILYPYFFLRDFP